MATLERLYEVLKKRFDDSHVLSPLEYGYIHQVQFIMSTIGSWPHKPFGRNTLHAVISLYNLLLLTVCGIAAALCILYWQHNRHDLSFFVLGHVILDIVFLIVAWLRVLIARTKKYQETVKVYLLEFHLFYFKHQLPYAAKVHQQIHIITEIFAYFAVLELCCGSVLFQCMVWYNNYRHGMFSSDRPTNSTFEHALYYYIPDSMYTIERDYWIVFTFNIFVSYVASVGLCYPDYVLCLMVIQIWGHLKVLDLNLKNISQPADNSSGMYTKEENVVIRSMLKKNIIHHNLILEFMDKCSDAYSEYLLVFYGFILVTTSVLLMEVSSLTADALAKYGAVTFAMHLQLAQVSVLSQMINTKCEQLIDGVYAMPWERMDNSNRKSVMLLLQMSQKVVGLMAGKVIPVGVSTMLSVLKTVYSYFMMLKALARE